VNFKSYGSDMNVVVPSSNRLQKGVAGTAVSFAAHLFGTLTCATCWTIFGPALALLFGSSVTGFMAAMRPLAPYAAGLSAIGLSYAVYQLVRTRERRKELPYRMAVAFTGVSVIGWTVSATFILTTLLKG